MTKARDLANLISGGAVLADGAIAVSEVTGLHAVASSGAASDLTGLHAVASSGAASDLTGLATVATSGAYTDVTGTPTLGTAASLDVGTGANNIPQLDSSGNLPAIDGSALTGIQGFSYASTLAFGDY